ncbi:MAG: hypothetical protein ACI9OJ_005402 [Myxococcota bacterium]
MDAQRAADFTRSLASLAQAENTQRKPVTTDRSSGDAVRCLSLVATSSRSLENQEPARHNGRLEMIIRFRGVSARSQNVPTVVSRPASS